MCVCVCAVHDRCWVRARKSTSVTRRRHIGRTSCFCQFSATRLTKTSTSSSRRLTILIRDMCETWSLDEPVTYTTTAAAATTTTNNNTNSNIIIIIIIIIGFCLTGLFFGNRSSLGLLSQRWTFRNCYCEIFLQTGWHSQPTISKRKKVRYMLSINRPSYCHSFFYILTRITAVAYIGVWHISPCV